MLKLLKQKEIFSFKIK